MRHNVSSSERERYGTNHLYLKEDHYISDQGMDASLWDTFLNIMISREKQLINQRFTAKKK